MTFADKFREKYRVALRAARSNDENATLTGLSDLYQLFVEQYRLDNGDSIVIKAKLSYWQDVFGGYIGIIRQYGLRDRRVQKFFGLIEDDQAPSFADILSGAGNIVPVQPIPERPYGGVDIAGIVPAATQPGAGTGEVPPAQEVDPHPPIVPDQVEPIAPDRVEPVAPDQVVPPPEGGIPPVAADGSETEVKPTFEPDTLEGFIGQRHIVRILLKEIAIAKAEGRHHLDNILLFGNPGLGKSTLMRLIAKALNVRYEWMDCSQYRNSQQSLKALQNFMMRVARENEPVVIAFDEIHRLTEELQSSLLTLLESRVYVSPPDVNGNIKRIPIDEFTFIAATTDDQKVIDTIKDRCLRLKFQMVDYTVDELKQIYRNKVAAKGLTITEDAIETCIPRSRGSIRYVNSFVEGMERMLYNEAGIKLSGNINKDTALQFFEERGIDEMGLEKKDLEILRVLADDPSGAMGAETLSARVGLDPKKYLSEYEPYLLKISFINVNGRGRSLTENAIKYLKGKEK